MAPEVRRMFDLPSLVRCNKAQSIVLVVSALFFAGLALHIHATYHATLAGIRTDARNVALTMDAHANTIFEHATHIIYGIEDAFALVGPRLDAKKGQAILEKWKTTSPSVLGILIFDAYGRLRHTTTGFLGESNKFDGEQIAALHRTHAVTTDHNQVHLGLMAPTDPQSRPHIMLSQGRREADGSLRNVYVVMFDPEIFAELYGSFELKPGRALSIVRNDGLYLFREPHRHEVGSSLAGSNLMKNHVPIAPHGDYIGRATTDNVERMFAYRSLEKFPAIVVAGLEVNSGISEWRSEALQLGVIGATVIGLMIFGLQRLLGQLVQAEAMANAHVRRLQALTNELARVEVRERKSLSRELHDGIAQSLAVASLRLSQLTQKETSATPKVDAGKTLSIHDELTGINYLVSQANEHVRNTLGQLAPPALEHLGLVPALQWLTEDMGKKFGLIVTFRDDGTPKELDEWRSSLVYRAVRELLINVVKHANINRAEVYCELDGDQINIMVSDEGSGFDPTNAMMACDGNRFGLVAIFERVDHLGGALRIDSRPGQGTTVHLSLPLNGHSVPEQARDPS